MFEAKELSFSYEKLLFDQLSFQIKRTEKLSIIGSSGEGKTTLAKIISGHIKPQNGQVFLNGNDTTNKPNKKIILIDQEDDLFPWLTVWKQVNNFCNDKFLSQKLLEMVELDKDRSRYPEELSGGMKKRLSIARALALQPELVVFDESFSALDHDLRKRVLNNYSTYADSTNLATLFISHNMDIVEDHLTGSIVLSDYR